MTKEYDRITIMFDNALLKKIRVIQSKQIATSNKNVSFSSVVNEILKKELSKHG